MSYTRPSLEVFIDFVQRYDKRVGLRKMYKDFNVPDQSRAGYRLMWDKIAAEISAETEAKKSEPKKKKTAKKKKKKKAAKKKKKR